MPDQIYAPGPEPAPLKYEVPGTQRMIPRAFQALFDGSGASGDYVPTVVIRSQAGHVIARAILDETVTAGDDAEVSWFPGVKHAAAAASAGAEWISAAHYLGDAAQNVGAGGFALVQWNHFHTSDSGLFSLTTITSGNDGVALGALGMYLVFAQVTFGGGAAKQDIRIQNAAFNYLDTSYDQLNSKNAAALYGQPWKLVDTQMVVTTDATQSIGVLAHNYDAGVAPISAAELAIYYFPNSVAGNP